MPTDTATPAATPEPRRDLEITITIHMRVPPPPSAPPPRPAARTTGADILAGLKAARDEMLKGGSMDVGTLLGGAPTPGCDCPACQLKRAARGGATMPPI